MKMHELLFVEPSQKILYCEAMTNTPRMVTVFNHDKQDSNCSIMYHPIPQSDSSSYIIRVYTSTKQECTQNTHKNLINLPAGSSFSVPPGYCCWHGTQIDM